MGPYSYAYYTYPTCYIKFRANKWWLLVYMGAIIMAISWEGWTHIGHLEIKACFDLRDDLMAHESNGSFLQYESLDHSWEVEIELQKNVNHNISKSFYSRLSLVQTRCIWWFLWPIWCDGLTINLTIVTPLPFWKVIASIQYGIEFISRNNILCFPRICR